MNFIEYEKEKVKNLDATETVWKLFKLTGDVNYARLLVNLTSEEVMQQVESEVEVEEHTMI